MVIIWLSDVLRLISEFQHVVPYLQPLFAVLAFIGWGAWAKVLVSLYFMVMTCNTIDSLIMKLVWFVLPAWPSPLYIGRYIMKYFSNCISFFFSSGGKLTKEAFSFTPRSPTSLFATAIESSEGFRWPLSTLETCLLIVLGISMLANIRSVFYPRPSRRRNILFRLMSKIQQYQVRIWSRVRRRYRRTTRRFSLRLDSYEWQGVWDSMGKYLGQWAPPVLWNFTTEQVQHPEKLVKHLNEVCCRPGYTREGQILATCWGLAYAYRALLNTIQHLQREKNVSGSDGKATDNAAMPTTSTAATQTLTTTVNTATPSTAATSTPVTSTTATQTLTTTDNATTPTSNTAVTPTPVTSTTATQTPTATDNVATPSTAATPTPVTSTVATQTPTATDNIATPSTTATPNPVTCTVAIQTPTATDNMATPSTAATLQLLPAGLKPRHSHVSYM